MRMTRPAHQTAFRPERRMMPGHGGRQADELSIRTDSNPTSSHLEEFEHVASPAQINHIFNLECDFYYLGICSKERAERLLEILGKNKKTHFPRNLESVA